MGRMTLGYGRDTLKLEDVIATFHSRKLWKMIEEKGDGGEGLYGRRKSNQTYMKKGQGGSYHMTYKGDYLVDFKDYGIGNVLLGDGKECRILGMGKIRVQIRDGLSFVLDNVKYHPNGMTFIYMARKRFRASRSLIAPPHVLPSPLVVPSSLLSHPLDSVLEEIMPP
nr:zinc finger, CCHC-type [Tanacetum cinerariifolium]